MMVKYGEVRSANPEVCGFCGSHASEMFDNNADFTRCDSCGAEVCGTDAFGVTNRWIWTEAKAAKKARSVMRAAVEDAEWNTERRTWSGDDY